MHLLGTCGVSISRCKKMGITTGHLVVFQFTHNDVFELPCCGFGLVRNDEMIEILRIMFTRVRVIFVFLSPLFKKQMSTIIRKVYSFNLVG